MPGFYDPRQEGELGDRAVARGCVTVIMWVALVRLVYIPAVLGFQAAGWGGVPLYVGAVSVGVLVASVSVRVYCVRARRRRRLSAAARAWRQRQGIRR